eukprot:scaffold55552_cov75-Cyclotella_meneghiniana.AAC.5
MSRFDQEIDARKPTVDSERSMEVRSGKGFCDSSMARIKRFQWTIEQHFLLNHGPKNFRKNFKFKVRKWNVQERVDVGIDDV